MTALPAHYSVNLSQHLAECDTNYLRLHKLMPEMQTKQQRRIGIYVGSQKQILVTFAVQDRSRYTTTLTMRQSHGIWGAKVPEMTVRVYHDARMAEVIAYQQMRAPRAKYSYPNPRMYARDEKRQLNRLLGEWLAVCLVHGHEPEPVISAQA